MKLEDAKLWTVEQCCGKGCDPVDDACDAAGHPYYDRIILHPEAWAWVRSVNDDEGIIKTIPPYAGKGSQGDRTMTEIKANIDGKAIQEAMAKAVLESSIGDKLNVAIDGILKERYPSTGSVIQRAVEDAVRDIVKDVARNLVIEKRETMEKMVEEKLTDSLISSIFDTLIGKMFDSY